MKLLQILIEHASHSLDRPFSYAYKGDKKIDVGFRVLVNFNSSELVGYVIECEETSKNIEQLEDELGFEISEIQDILDESPLLNNELLLLADRMSEYYLAPKISVLQTMLPPSLNIRRGALKAPKIAYDKYLKVVDDSEDNLTGKQIEILRLIKQNGEVLKREIKSVSIVDKLIELGRIEVVLKEKRRLKLPDYEIEQPRSLSEEQKLAIDEFNNSDKKIFLLEGVTGSGKTEVYLRLSEQVLSMGKSVIMLVPEISLTPMMTRYFLKRFKDNVAILHSELTPSEKYDEYRKIAKGDAKIVVGARSAIFAPVRNLGLIIMDEEHVESYKQDTLPFYHAREVAIFRSEISGAKFLMGSATPSLETRARAHKNIYHLLKLTKRINNQPLPKTTIVNMLDYTNIDRNSYIFSFKLRQSIEKVLQNKEQAILLINRRGFSTHVSCRNCGYTFKCPTCGIALTYHKSEGLLKCHHCDYVEVVKDNCPECGSKYLMKTGFGTERIEEEVNRLFPEARTLRLDSDSARVRTRVSKIVNAFENKEADILIGTQMIAKGHDFGNVTLVGIVLADIGLNMPNYRSSERAFQLITQAVGRCGRQDKKGEAVIQTYSPNHYAITMAARQNYEVFYSKEMGMRKLQNYPPYCYLCSITLSGRSEEKVIEAIYRVVDDLNSKLNDQAQVLGPITPYISFEQNIYKRSILIKYKNMDLVRDVLKQIISTLKRKSTINIAVNIDPYNF